MNKFVNEKEFYTTAELAKILKISRIAVFNKIKKGQIKAQKMGRNFVIFKKDIMDLSDSSVDLFDMASGWIFLGKKFPEEFYCQNSAVFQSRLTKMEYMMMKEKFTEKIFSLLTSIAGEIGNNSYDHNIGRWPDEQGIFFGYDLSKGKIVLADRGIGILESLKRVRTGLKNHTEALKVAFTEVVSGRAPESRGNGLKYVKAVIEKYPISLDFQTGNATLALSGNSTDLKIQTVKNNMCGCIAIITY